MYMKKVAVVGGGKWGINLSRNFQELGALKYICDRNESRLKELGAMFQEIEFEGNVNRILDDPEIKGVAVATPPGSHYEVGIKVLQAGKHLFVEKPMTLDVDESRRLKEKAAGEGLILMVGHILLYNPAYVKLRELIERGDLGELCHIQAQRIGLGRVRREEDALFSLAPHDISAMLYLFGENPLELSCFGMDFLQKGIMDIVYVNLRFPGNKIGQIQVSWYSPEKVRQHTVVGTSRMAQIDELSGKGVLKLYESSVDPQSLAVNSGSPELVKLSGEEPLKEECRHFLSVIDSGQTPRSDGSQGLAVVQILDTAKESASRRGEWLPLGDIR
jgi:UDP-2-acetamido-3-amino-2,3-dideoxy-glucuronate N-acetyltransferase